MKGGNGLAFSAISDAAKAYIILLVMLSTILLLVALIFHIVEKSKSYRVALLCSLLALSILNYSALSELNKVGREKYHSLSMPVFSPSNSIPYYLHIILSLLMIIYAVATTYKLYQNDKNRINTFSVKESLENLPTGIAFMTSDEELILSNHIMHSLYKELAKKPLRSAAGLWQDITALQGKNNCVIKGKEPAFILDTGRVWQFSKSQCRYNDEDYLEFKATDITELYNLSENTRNLNERLLQQHTRLKKLDDIIEENAGAQVAVNMKINFHDNFGNLLTLTKKTLREKENTGEVKTLVEYWGNLNNVVCELSRDDRQRITLEQVMLFADKLGCEISLSGELPTQEHNKTTILLCINEMIKNAYRHAGANKLMVNISHTPGIQLTIQNETEHIITEIKEGSGLSGLRQRIEQSGGEMSMSCDNGVTMSVKLLDIGEENV